MPLGIPYSPNWRRWASDANGLTGQDLEMDLPPAPAMGPPAPVSLPTDLGAAPGGLGNGMPMNLQAIRLAENAIAAPGRTPPSPETMALAQKAPSGWRMALGALANTFTPSAGFAPLITYGPKGLQARQEMAQWQSGLPTQLSTYKTLNDMYNVESDNDRLNRTATANIAQSQAAAGASQASAEAARALAMQRQGIAAPTTLATRMGVPEGTKMPLDLIEQGTRPSATQGREQMAVTQELVSRLPELGLTEGEQVPVAVYNNLVDAATVKAKDPQVEIATDERTGTLRGINRTTGQVLWTSEPGVAMKRPPQAPASLQVVAGTGMTRQDLGNFNTLVDKRNKDPLVAAADRTAILKGAIQDVRKDPSNGALQYTLFYPLIQAMDTYQSSVREGEMQNLKELDSYIGQWGNVLAQIRNRQVVSPDMALALAAASERVLTHVQTAAQAADAKYAAQARINGPAVESAWNEWKRSVQPQGAAQPQTGAPAVGQTFNGRRVTSVVEVK